jgi:alpha-L-rhamnosidase
MIDNGATTIWERWDGYVRGRGFQDPGMNSFNHWALGSVGEWLYQHVLGIQPDPGHPGFKRFTIDPRPGGGVTWAKGSYRSIRGMIQSAWSIENGRMVLRVGIPANTVAAVKIQSRDPAQVLEKDPAGRSPQCPARLAQGVRFLKREGSRAVFEVGSGNYEFTSTYE